MIWASVLLSNLRTPHKYLPLKNYNFECRLTMFVWELGQKGLSNCPIPPGSPFCVTLETGASSVTFSTLILNRTSEHRNEPERMEAEMADVALKLLRGTGRGLFPSTAMLSHGPWIVGSSTLSYLKSAVTGLIPLSKTLWTEFSYWFKKKDKFWDTGCLWEDFASYPAGICRITTGSWAWSDGTAVLQWWGLGPHFCPGTMILCVCKCVNSCAVPVAEMCLKSCSRLQWLQLLNKYYIYF